MHDAEIRVFTSAGFNSVPAPDWYHEAVRISEAERDWHKAISRVLMAEHNGLTASPLGEIGTEVHFWRSADHGTYVEINNQFGLIEQVLVLDDRDWLPFLTTHLVPLISVASQCDIAHQLERIGNALISYGRHGQGHHIDRYTALSRIDTDRDAAARARFRRQD